MPDHHGDLLATQERVAAPGAEMPTAERPRGLIDLDGEAAAVARALFAPAVYAESAQLSEPDADRLWEHCVQHWAPGDAFPSLFFDPEYYAQRISNGEAPALGPEESIFLHWLYEGLPRRVVPTPRFDEDFYHREHWDIAHWGTFGFAHFVQHGLREGRRPTAWFDPRWYAHELGSAPRTEAAYVHFLTDGIVAGFTANEGLARFLAWRDCAMTPTQYDELLTASIGWSRNLDAGSFKFLLALYVPESHPNHSGVDDLRELATYFRHGVATGTSPGPLFDASAYSLLDWLAEGVGKRIVPTARFDEAFYHKTYADIARASMWGFEHFVFYGALEGRIPNAAFLLRKDLSGRTSGLPLCYRSWIREDSAVPAPAIAHGKETARRGTDAATESETAAIEAWNQRARVRRSAATPAVSVIVPAHEDRRATIRCMASIARAFPSCDAEFIVVDDGSSDGTAEAVAALTGVRCVRIDRTQGTAQACNRGAAVARGDYLCFIRDAAAVYPGWLDRMVAIVEADDAIGIVGAKLIRPDGRLESAGGIVWRDGTLSSYGRFGRPDDPQYNFIRDVDSIGTSAFVVRAELFRRLGGFSENFGASEHESSDLCLGVRSLGYRVVYQPLSEVRLRNGATSHRNERARFCEKWRSQLRGHFENTANVNAAARRINRQHVVLMLTSAEPREPGSKRLTHIASVLRQIGYSVVVFPFAYAEPEYASELQQLGVEVLYRTEDENGRNWAEVFEDVTLLPDLVWIDSPQVFEAYGSLLHRYAQTKVVYDALGMRDAEWFDWRRLEADLGARADATVVATEDDKLALEAAGACEVYIVPNVDAAAGTDLEAQTLWTVELRLRELLGSVRRRSVAKPGRA
ncbi:MAG TPA: glycosyltransferase family 2 protein [Candidatus Acidoferrales bacterium]|jgi:GT2 family glycosyltransferase|nr:glycosyltransferase family 2 protein [Candidatus Acidoferrales bacterium]